MKLQSLMARARSWMRAFTQRNRLEQEMEAELADHLERLAADLEAAGFSPAEAQRRARIAIGSASARKEEMRASLGLRWGDELAADLRYGARMLRKSPGFTAIAAGSLALAIGANTTIFSLAKQLLYERLAVPHAAELRLLAWTSSEEHRAVHHVWGDEDPLPGGRIQSTSWSYVAYRHLRDANRALGDLFAFKSTGMNATIAGQAQPVQAEMVSGNYYAALGVQPQLGRAIEPQDDAVAGQGAVAVLSEGLWERAFGRSPNVIGQTIKLSNVPLTIIGVNPRGFTGAKDVQQSPDVFIPLAMQPLLRPMPSRNGKAATALEDPGLWWVNVMGRVQPGVPDQAAQAELAARLNAVVHATMTLRPKDDVPHLELRDGSRGLFHEQARFARPMAVLMTLVGFVLLMACANIANLMLARGAQRQREMSVRLALGAGRARVLRQMLVESLMLAVLGGAGGLLLGYFGRNALPKLMENAWERNDFHVAFDWRVFAFTAAITIATGILFGLAPAFTAARAEVTHGLKENALTVTRKRKGFSGKALVGVQIALSTLLVIGAGLFLRTLAGLSTADVGFRTDHLLLVGINPPPSRYPAGKDIVLHQRLEQAFAAVPGVESVSLAMEAYVSGDLSSTDFLPEGERSDLLRHDEEDFNVVGNDFFRTMGIPIVAGRAFGPQDTSSSMRVAVINQALARKRFPGQNPIGKRFTIGGHNADGHGGTFVDDRIEIVGVCGDTRYENMRSDPPPQFILPFVQQAEIGGVTFALRTHVDAATLVPGLRRVVQQVDPDLPLVEPRTQEQQIDADLVNERVFVALIAGFGLMALALACVGIYGVMAYSVSQRTNEIGIRMALGAQPAQMRMMVLRESSWITAIGIACGLVMALLLARLVQSMLYGIGAYDPLTLCGAVALLLLVAIGASWVPAWRAARVQPVKALRHE